MNQQQSATRSIEMETTRYLPFIGRLIGLPFINLEN